MEGPEVGLPVRGAGVHETWVSLILAFRVMDIRLPVHRAVQPTCSRNRASYPPIKKDLCWGRRKAVGIGVGKTSLQTKRPVRRG